MTSRWIYSLFAALAVLPFASAFAQNEARGTSLYHRFFRPNEYGLHPTNWAIAQEGRGLIYAGNDIGLATFDGAEWRMYDVPNRRARSLAFDDTGAAYVGGIDEVGRMVPDSLGRLRYESLLPYVPASLGPIGEVWNTVASDGGVVFQTREHLLLWDGTRFEVLTPTNRISRLFESEGTIYVHLQEGALYRLEEARLRRVPGTERLARARLFAVHQLRDGALLIGTRAGEFYRWERGALRPAFRALSERLANTRPYAFASLPLPESEVFAIGTFGGGIYLIDETGAVLDRVGLTQEDMVLDLTFDHQGGLWAALYDGLLRVDVLPSVTQFTADEGLRGIVEYVVRHDGTLYAATSLGVYRLLETVGADARWEPVIAGAGQGWMLRTANGRLLAAMNEGLFEITGSTATQINGERAFEIYTPPDGNDWVYVGLKEGIALLRRTSEAWEEVGRVEGVEGEVFTMGEAEGVLWVTLSSGEILRLDTSTGLLTPTVSALPEADRPGGRLYFTEIGGAFAAVGEHGVFRLRRRANEAPYLAPDADLNAALGADGETYLLLSEVGDDLWVARGRSLFVLEPTAEGYRRQHRPDLPLDDLHVLYVGQDGDAVWIATDDGLLRYDPASPKRYDVPYAALVRSVSRGGRLIFGGAYGQGRVAARQSERERPVLDASREELRFEVAAASYNAPERVEYQYYLEGFDRDWSTWSTETVRTYTNLPGRKRYVFRVRARNVHGVVSEEAAFGFRVLPPWYLTPWAYAGYVVLLFGSLWGLSTLRLRRHQNELIRERMTRRRLARMNEQLEHSLQRLAEADDLKDSLLENVSHELRTPLTSMLASAELLGAQLEERDPSGAELATSMLVGANRLTQTVQDMMDVANLQAGRFRLTPEQVDVADVLNGLVDAMGEAAARKGLYVKLLPEHLALPAVTDRGAVERIAFHLLHNAIKFTDGGGVTLVLDADADTVYLRVTDSGVGIPADQLDHLQRAFTQHSTGQARSHEGSGLGLYIVAMLVGQMRGTLHFEPGVAGGTTVSVTWPRYDRRGPTAGPHDSEGYLSESLTLLYVNEGAASSVTLVPTLKRLCRVRTTTTLRAAKHAARLFPYDGVVIQADEAQALDAERVLQTVPGYDQVPYLLVQDDENAPPSRAFFATLHLGTSPRSVEEVLAAAMTAYLRYPSRESPDAPEWAGDPFDEAPAATEASEAEA